MATNEKGLVMGGHDGPLLPDGVVAPILTPFEADLSVSHDRLVAHAQRVLDEGCVGVAVFGTTGEALSVATREREAALEALVAGGIDPGVMIVGTGVTNLPGTVHLTRHAMEMGCRACMVLPPFYFKDPLDYKHYIWSSCIIFIEDKSCGSLKSPRKNTFLKFSNLFSFFKDDCILSK